MISKMTDLKVLAIPELVNPDHGVVPTGVRILVIN
jgi:hypothetical protein